MSEQPPRDPYGPGPTGSSEPPPIPPAQPGFGWSDSTSTTPESAPPPAYDPPPAYGTPPPAAYGAPPPPPAYGASPAYGAPGPAGALTAEGQSARNTAIVWTIINGLSILFCGALLSIVGLIFGILGITKSATDVPAARSNIKKSWIWFIISIALGLIFWIGLISLGALGSFMDTTSY